MRSFFIKVMQNVADFDWQIEKSDSIYHEMQKSPLNMGLENPV